jgi:hypothetical protein
VPHGCARRYSCIPRLVISKQTMAVRPHIRLHGAVLTSVQLSLRSFSLDHDSISTFERDPACDPTAIETVDPNNKDLKYTVIFSKILPLPVRRNPIPLESRPAPAEALRGFPICWFVPELAWLPYLPAVVTYHYPIFRNMNRSPDVVAAGEGFAANPSVSGFVLDPTVVLQWSNVESAMQKMIRELETQGGVDPRRGSFFPPSSYGYRKTFPRREMAKASISSSLHAFHHMLAYCSYMIAHVTSLRFSQYQHKTLCENPTEVDSILEKIVPDDDLDDSHVLLKLIWSTLGEIRCTRNFVGAAVAYGRPFDCQLVQGMYKYGVPVFVRWSTETCSGTYRGFPHSEVLDRWCPFGSFQREVLDPWCPSGSFAILDQPPASSNPPNTSPAQQPLSFPPRVAALNPRLYRYPLEYVKARKAEIEFVFPIPQSWPRRQARQHWFYGPGRHSGFVFQFSFVNAVEQSTGNRVTKWERTQLTRSATLLLWDEIHPRNLWYGRPLSHRFLF